MRRSGSHRHLGDGCRLRQVFVADAEAAEEAAEGSADGAARNAAEDAPDEGA
jgi:hypothetical protein